jgi:hypothetical protein
MTPPSSPRAGRSTVSAATITQAESLRIVPATTDYSIGYNDALADIVAGVNRAAASPAGPEAVPQSEREGLDARMRAARFVAEHWRDAYMEYLRGGQNQYGIGTHPLSLVLLALDGETNPAELGLSDDVHDAFRAALASPAHPDEEPRP